MVFIKSLCRPFDATISALITYSSLTKHIAAFAVMYGIFLSFSELGPGNCTFMLATKAGPTAVRGHFFGFAAAMGKVGAFAGIWAFPAMINGTDSS